MLGKQLYSILSSLLLSGRKEMFFHLRWFLFLHFETSGNYKDETIIFSSECEKNVKNNINLFLFWGMIGLIVKIHKNAYKV